MKSVVDEFLRDELNYVVVKSWDAADAGVRMLETDVAGRATFLVHGEEAHAKFSSAVAMGPMNGTQFGGRGGGAEGLRAGAEWVRKFAGRDAAEAAAMDILRRIRRRRGGWRVSIPRAFFLARAARRSTTRR